MKHCRSQRGRSSFDLRYVRTDGRGSYRGTNDRISACDEKELRPLFSSPFFVLDSGRFEIGVTRAGSTTVKGATKYYAERGSFGTYQFTEAASYLGQPRWTQPGECDLYVLLPDGHYVRGSVSVKP